MWGRPSEMAGLGRRRRSVCTDSWVPCSGSGQGGCDSPSLAVASVGLGVGPVRANRKPKSFARKPRGVACKTFLIAAGQFLLARKPRRPCCDIAHPGRKTIRLVRGLPRLARDCSCVVFATLRVLRASQTRRGQPVWGCGRVLARRAQAAMVCGRGCAVCAWVVGSRQRRYPQPALLALDRGHWPVGMRRFIRDFRPCRVLRIQRRAQIRPAQRLHIGQTLRVGECVQ